MEKTFRNIYSCGICFIELELCTDLCDLERDTDREQTTEDE
jgi:hypothetical protein